jgi:polyribonucleotide 5'-hydroxyl-kinase
VFFDSVCVSPAVAVVVTHSLSMQDKLFNDLERDLRATKDWHAKGCVVIEKLPRSEGVVSRSTGVRKDSRKARIREYFYGKDGSLAPYSRTLSFDDFTLVKLSSVTVRDLVCPGCCSGMDG